MSSPILTMTALLSLALPTAAALAQDTPASDIRSLDGQVQEVKSDVLKIASELNVLEERLLFPSNTQLAVFVATARGEDFRLDSIRIELDGEPATHHIYSYAELEALMKGGVQRLYTGNVATGEHRLVVTMAGKLKNGTEFEQSDAFVFTKEVKPKSLAITLSGPGSGQNGIELGDW